MIFHSVPRRISWNFLSTSYNLVRNERNVSAIKCYAHDATRDQTLLIYCIKVARRKESIYILRNIAHVIYRSVEIYRRGIARVRDCISSIKNGSPDTGQTLITER